MNIGSCQLASVLSALQGPRLIFLDTVPRILEVVHINAEGASRRNGNLLKLKELEAYRSKHPHRHEALKHSHAPLPDIDHRPTHEASQPLRSES
jgi:hypothetical protein